MISDFSQYYVGTRDVTPYTGVSAWKGNQKIVDDTLGLAAEKIVSYDFSNAEELTKEDMDSLANYYADQGVIVEITGTARSKTSLFGEDWQIELKRQVKEMTEKAKLIEIASEHVIDLVANGHVSGSSFDYQDVEEKVLNHSFSTKNFTMSKEFDKYAIGYAKYLNSSVESPYDNVFFYGFENEDFYRNYIAKEFRGAANQILSYFSSEPFIYEQDESQSLIDILSKQLADSSIEYAKRVAQGDTDLNNLTSILNIYGAEISYSQLMSAQSMLQQLNDSGLAMANWSPGLFPEKFSGDVRRENYGGLENTWDCAFYANMGLKTAMMTAYCDSSLPSSFADLVKNTYYNREKNVLNSYMTRTESIHGEEFSQWVNSYRKNANDLFRTLDISNAETATSNFEAALKQLETLRNEYYRAKFFDPEATYYRKDYAVDALKNTFQEWLKTLSNN